MVLDVAELHIVGPCRQILFGDDGHAVAAVGLMVNQMDIPSGIDFQLVDALVDVLLDGDFFLGEAYLCGQKNG